MPETYERLEDFLANQDPHSHLRPDQARQMHKAGRDGGFERMPDLQIIVLGCVVCTAYLGDNDPTLYASSTALGFRTVLPSDHTERL